MSFQLNKEQQMAIKGRDCNWLIMAAEVSSAVLFGIFVKNNNLVFRSQVEFNAQNSYGK